MKKRIDWKRVGIETLEKVTGVSGIALMAISFFIPSGYLIFGMGFILIIASSAIFAFNDNDYHRPEDKK